MRAPLILSTAVTAALLAAAPASAAEYVTAPGSTRTATPCTVEQPCQLHFAVTSLSNKFDVARLTAGDYNLGGTTLIATNGQIVGAAGARPRITKGQLVVGDGASASHLDFTGTGAAPLKIAGGVVSDIRSDATGAGAVGVQFSQGLGGMLRNAIVHAVGDQAVAVDGQERASNATPQPGRLFKVTAVAEGQGSFGVRAQTDTAKPGGGCQITTSTLGLKDVIARGEGAALFARTLESSSCIGHGAANITVESSNFTNAYEFSFATITYGNGNQQQPGQTAGVFADAEFHQALGSATVDAGTTDQTGPEVDPDGDVTPSGSAPDIGGDEVPAPVGAPTTGTPVAAADGSVSVPVTVTTGAQAARVVVDYGPTTAYGSSSAAMVVAAGQSGAVRTLTVPGTHAGETLHVRARAIVGGDAQNRQTTGGDRVITLAAAAVPVVGSSGTGTPTGATPPKQDGTAPTLRQLLRRLQVAHGITGPALRKGISVRATLRGPGVVTLRLTVRVGKRNIVVARARGKRKAAGVLKLRLVASKSGLARLGGRKVSALLAVRASGNAAFAPSTRSVRVVVRGR